MPNLGSGNWLVMIRGAFGSSYKGAQSVIEVTLVLGSVSVALVQGLAPVTLDWDSTAHAAGVGLPLPRRTCCVSGRVSSPAPATSPHLLCPRSHREDQCLYHLNGRDLGTLCSGLDTTQNPHQRNKRMLPCSQSAGSLKRGVTHSLLGTGRWLSGHMSPPLQRRGQAGRRPQPQVGVE